MRWSAVVLVALSTATAGCLFDECDDWSYGVWQDPGLASAAWNTTTEREFIAGLKSPDLPPHLRISKLETRMDGFAVIVDADPSRASRETVLRVTVITSDQDPTRASAIAEKLFAEGAPGDLLRDFEFWEDAWYGTGWYGMASLPDNLTLVPFGLAPGPWVSEERHNGNPGDGYYNWSAPGTHARAEATVREFRLSLGNSSYRSLAVDSMGRAWTRLGGASERDLETMRLQVLEFFPSASFPNFHEERYAMCT